jgi:endogenous inhibitor of DNA gyrase (YacG/DUF329 family)
MASVSCPTCNRPVEWSEASPWRPFCSERCKLIDLGAWAAEKHAIPGDVPPPDEDPDKDADE